MNSHTTNNNIEIINDMDKSIKVMFEAGTWMKDNGHEYSEWWDPNNMNKTFLSLHAEPNEFFVALVGEKAAASVILQDNERNQSWKYVDKNNPQKALYVHWLCVSRQFSGTGLPSKMITFAKEYAKKRSLSLLRLDTQADEPKLCNLYEGLGFYLVDIDHTDTHPTAFFQIHLD